MKLRRVHVSHSAVVLAVIVLVGFAAAFLADAAMTNDTYDALAAHHVAVTAQTIKCFYRPRPSRGSSVGPPNLCQVRYSVKGHTFYAAIAATAPKVFYVDPSDPGHRMNQLAFAKGPLEVTGDIVIAILLLSGAAAVTTVHQIHLRRRRRAVSGRRRP